MPPPNPEPSLLYDFEKRDGRAGHRDPQTTLKQLKILWARLSGEMEQLLALETKDPDGWKFLQRYVADGPLSINWYEAKRPELVKKQRRYNLLVATVILVLFALACALPFEPLLVALLFDDAPREATGLVDVAALVGVVGTGGTVALRMSAQVVRYRRQAAVFHKASAALKEQLYRLELEWNERPLVDTTGRLVPEFDTAIRRALGSAQSTLSSERDEFFDTLIVDVSALTDHTATAAKTIAGTAALRVDRRHQHAQQRVTLKDQIAKARLTEQTAASKLQVLEDELAAGGEDLKLELAPLLREHRLAQKEAELEAKHLAATLDEKYGG